MGRLRKCTASKPNSKARDKRIICLIISRADSINKCEARITVLWVHASLLLDCKSKLGTWREGTGAGWGGGCPSGWGFNNPTFYCPPPAVLQVGSPQKGGEGLRYSPLIQIIKQIRSWLVFVFIFSSLVFNIMIFIGFGTERERVGSKGGRYVCIYCNKGSYIKLGDIT